MTSAPTVPAFEDRASALAGYTTTAPRTKEYAISTAPKHRLRVDKKGRGSPHIAAPAERQCRDAAETLRMQRRHPTAAKTSRRHRGFGKDIPTYEESRTHRDFSEDPEISRLRRIRCGRGGEITSVGRSRTTIDEDISEETLRLRRRHRECDGDIVTSAESWRDRVSRL